MDSHIFMSFKWVDGTILSMIKAKNIYNVISYNVSIIDHINNTWYSDCDISLWQKYFTWLWKGLVAPKIKCFKWLLLLDILPLRKDFSSLDYCNLCKLPDSCRHISF